MDAPRAPISIKREDLYEAVWTTSVFQLAKTYGVSDVGLAKACARHQILRPSLGYWAKKAVGKAPPRPPLPVVVDASLQTITLSPPARRSAKPILVGARHLGVGEGGRHGWRFRKVNGRLRPA